MSLVLFWGAMATIVYTYLIYPIIILLRGIFWVRPYKTAGITPHVSLIIAAYNESQSIAAKIENILALDYPPEQLEVVIASDGSNDGTDAIVRSYARANLRLLSLPRQGKAPALNSAVAASTGEILVFSDANSMYAPDAIRALVRPFAAPEVGGVAGNQVYLKKKGDTGLTGAGEQSYWDFDRQLKQLQSKSGNVISATGAIYALRRTLFHPVMGGVTDDFTISTDVIVQGAAAGVCARCHRLRTRRRGRRGRIWPQGAGDYARAARRARAPYAAQPFSLRFLCAAALLA